MRTLAAIAIALGIFVLTSAAFAYGPAMGGWGGGWGGHMMAPGYHMTGNWEGHMGPYWNGAQSEGYTAPDRPAAYGPGYGWCHANWGPGYGWNTQAPPADRQAPGATR